MGVAQSDTVNAADRLDEAVLLSVSADLKHGDFSVRMPLEWTGVAGTIAGTRSDVIAADGDLGRQAGRVAGQNVEVERNNQEVELAKQQAEQIAISSKYKSEFFSNLSHELRTPLNSLLILACELADNVDANLTETQVQYASVIHSSGTDLLRLLNDILDLAKGESGTVSLQISELPLAELQRALRLDFGHLAEGTGLEYAVKRAPDLPVSIATDPGRLRQVLTNLVANAEELQRRIFEGFAQADDVEALVSVPPAAAIESPAEATPPRAAGASLAGMKVLLVDDDIRSILALTTLLERGKLEVVSAESGAETLALLEQASDIDVVLVDVTMPVMDGYATMRAIRELPRYGDIPILAVTAKVEAGERQRCVDAGASACVSKPVEADALLLTLGERLPAAAPAEAIDGNP